MRERRAHGVGRVLAAALLAATTAAAQGPPAPPAPPADGTQPLDPDVRAVVDSIESGPLMATIRFLASNRLEGREAGERGLEVAADYLVSRFQALGARPVGGEGFRQSFRLRYRFLTEDEQFSVAREVGAGLSRREFELRRDFVPFAFSEEGEVEAPLAFAGYGIVAPEFGWDDYAALGKQGARGKIVVVFRNEPDQDGEHGRDFFDGKETTLHASLRQKAREAAAHGAVGLIVVDGPASQEVLENPSSSAALRTRITEAQRELERDDPDRPRTRPDIPGHDAPLGVVAVHASQELLRWLDRERDWAALQQQMDDDRKPAALDFPDASARIVHDVYTELRDTANVLAVVPGSDPELREEYVLVGGHYDHVGKDDRNDDIYNGADDNASGTATVVAVAEAFAALEEPPRRSTIFVAFAAEEKGLLGSDWFARNPPVPLENIVAAINLDMVGRNDEGEISIVGRDMMPELAGIFDRYAGEVGLTLNDDAGAGAGRSDNASLWLGGIPTVSLFSGTHEDYHEPSDTADKIVPGKVRAVARLAFLVAWEIAADRTVPPELKVPAGPWKPIAPDSRIESAAAEEGGS
jgi:hypothetical protein